MKLQLSIRLLSIIGIIILGLYYPPGASHMIGVYGMDPGSSIDVIDLEIETTLDLESTSSIEFTRNFSITQKQDFYLLHLDVEASENTVKKVIINATINNIETIVEFKDSSSVYTSPHSFYGGTRLTTQINPETQVSVLSNNIKLSIDVISSSLFSEAGTFHIDKVTFEGITPSLIDSESENVALSMEVSSGSWYIAPLSTLNERKLISDLFINVDEDHYFRFDLNVTPSDYPLSTTDFSISNTYATFESESSQTNAMQKSVYADLTKGDNLVLEFKFRPSSDLVDTVIKLSIEVKVTAVTRNSDIPPSQPGEESSNLDLNFLNLALPDLELIRFSMILIPLVLYFNRRKKPNTDRSLDYVEKGDINGAVKK